MEMSSAFYGTTSSVSLVHRHCVDILTSLVFEEKQVSAVEVLSRGSYVAKRQV